MFEAVGHEVIHLRRTTLGPLTLKDMLPGQFRTLNEREVADLKRAAGLKVAAPNRGARVAAIVEERKARRGAGRVAAPPRYSDERTAAPAPAQGAGLGAPVPAARAGGQARPAFGTRGARPSFGGRKSGPAKNRKPR
jgi:hypothetical protein